MKTSYGYNKVLDCDFNTAIVQITEELKKEGFGILSDINIKEKLKEKLDKNIDEYIILGACNPSLAYQALQVEQEIGLLLPCNVIVYKKDDAVIVSALRPSQAMGFIDNKKLTCIAGEVEEKLIAIIDRL